MLAAGESREMKQMRQDFCDSRDSTRQELSQCVGHSKISFQKLTTEHCRKKHEKQITYPKLEIWQLNYNLVFQLISKFLRLKGQGRVYP